MFLSPQRYDKDVNLTIPAASSCRFFRIFVNNSAPCFVQFRIIDYICNRLATEVASVFLFIISVSCFILFKEIANFQNIEGGSSQEKRSCLSYIHSRQGESICNKAWEWTVYSMLGVWRCLLEDKLNIVPRFFFIIKLLFTPSEERGWAFY